MKLRHLLVALACLVLPSSAWAEEKDAHSSRLQRPLNGAVSQTRLHVGTSKGSGETGVSQKHIEGLTDENLFKSEAEWQKLTGQSESTSNNSEQFFADSYAASKDQAHSPSQGVSNGAGPDSAKPAEEKTVKDRALIIRLTGFAEDLNITPTINFDGLTMAQKLQDQHRPVVVLLERSSVKLASNGSFDLPVNGNPVDFRKLLRKVITNGGRVILNKRWADEFGVQKFACIGGAEILTPDEVAQVVIESEKIVDYAAPVYPFNVMVRPGN